MNFLAVIVSLFALALLVSQTAIDVFATLTCGTVVWMAFRWWQQKSSKYFFVTSGIDWLFAVWFGVVFISFAVNGFSADSWYFKLIEFRWILIFYLLSIALRELDPSEAVIKWGAIAFGLCSIWAIVVWFLGFDPIHPSENLQTIASGAFRTGGFHFQPIIFAHLYQLPLCLLIGIGLMLIRWREKGIWLVILSVAFGVVAIILSFTRGVWISLAVASFVMLYFYNRRLSIVFLSLSLSVFGIAYKYIPVFHDRIHYTFDAREVERVWIWKANLVMIKEHPVFGVGYGENKNQLRYYLEKIKAPEEIIAASLEHAHNQYIEILAGTGIVGFIVYISIFLYFLKLSILVWRKTSARDIFEHGLALGIIGAQVAFLVGGFTEANLEHSKMKHTLLFVWALLVWLAHKNNILREKV